MIRVLLDCRMAGWSGIGRYTTGLARALADRADVELTQICARGEEPPTPSGPLVRTPASSAHPFTIRGALELSRLAREAKPDIIHCLHFPTPAPLQRPVVVTLHDLIPLVSPGAMREPLSRAAYRVGNARAVRTAEKVVVPSHATAEDIYRLFPKARDKVVVIPEAADDFARGTVAPLPRRLEGLTSEPYVLSMGNTRPHKDLPTLLRAFSILAPSFPKLSLLLVGREPPGYLDAQLLGVSAEARDRANFTGDVDDGALRALYIGAAAFVFPSRCEGFGLPVLEAMSLGAPVICAEAASLPEVVGNAGILFPVGDHDSLAREIAEVLRDPTLHRRLSDAGRNRAAQFTWADTAAATFAVYTSVLQDRDSSSHGREK